MVSRRTAQRTVQQAYALIREDIDKANVQRSDLVAQAIHLLMESARLGFAQNNPGGGWDEAVAQNLEAGFYNHAFCPVGPEGPAFCIWEVREGITAEQFQEFIDGPNGVNFGLGAWMNICREINVEMAGNPPYPRKF